MTTLQVFLAEQYAAELAAFRASLDSVDDTAFSAETLGHSPAWHALHIAEWLRLTVLKDRTPKYHHLGWEDKPWVGPLGTEAALLGEDAGKVAVLTHLDSVSAQVLERLHALTPEDLAGMTFSPSAPNGERPMLAALGLHLRHIAYHRGQVQLAKKA